jgi:membrane protein DedA with SNARE-associated domain
VHEITDAVTQWIADYGLYAIFFLSLVDAVLPAASEVVMVYAGALAGGAFAGQTVTLFGEPIESTFWAWLAVVIAGTAGYVLGSVGGWAIGLYAGRPYLERHGRWLHITPERLDDAERWFGHYGNVTVLVSRMLPVVRSFISIPAGVAEMPLGRYTVLTTAGSIPWYAGLAAIGVAVGANWERFHEAFRYADIAAVVLVIALAAGALWHHRRRRRRRRGTT